MSREIKFRVFDSVTKSLDGWYYAKRIPLMEFESERYTLEQFTGLKDRYGVEIYEGDILKRVETPTVREYCGVVRYEDREFTTADYTIDIYFEQECVLNFVPEIIEVVGNIHEKHH
tara:strand:- start:269 stop:616 length:348 start_codon:yes stop_codon:yes gene_type:complete